MAKKMLMVVTSADKINSDNKTGIWVSEFVEPYLTFIEAGYDVTVASPGGGKAPLDPVSIENDQPEAWNEPLKRLEETAPLQQVSKESYDGIFLPGGHGTMFDFPDDPSLQTILTHFADHNLPIGAVCHGPAGFVKVKKSDGTSLVDGRRMTAFTNEEEESTELDKHMPFLLETSLRENGALFEMGPMWSDYVVTDGNLVTGQNPQSSLAVAKAFVDVVETMRKTTYE
ncbi:type 1 glutamine amidotransferase domain-containing protein [Bacillus sp. H-16]|uniref:type 1 glutamine amidotransferase domain-containing protein n=1 Tax=Alteribacter salitolerans TaxID=2912333 RepID=UPI0019626A99|nr:type 1 glutamine amidotransferase domain-containing protein [Alteribacter salitolerans]MBM7094530.1 type 1 glutamine amidotransferase domain-containing protein [Alteribacter salitolerans]